MRAWKTSVGASLREELVKSLVESGQPPNTLHQQEEHMRTYKIAVMAVMASGPRWSRPAFRFWGLRRAGWQFHPGLPGLRLGFGLLPEAWRDDAGRWRRPAPQ